MPQAHPFSSKTPPDSPTSPPNQDETASKILWKSELRVKRITYKPRELKTEDQKLYDKWNSTSCKSPNKVNWLPCVLRKCRNIYRNSEYSFIRNPEGNFSCPDDYLSKIYKSNRSVEQEYSKSRLETLIKNMYPKKSLKMLNNNTSTPNLGINEITCIRKLDTLLSLDLPNDFGLVSMPAMTINYKLAHHVSLKGGAISPMLSTSEQWLRELEYLEAQFKEKGFEVIDVPGDGNCQFSAIATALPQLNQNQAYFRNVAVEQLKSNIERYQVAVQNESIEQHIKKMSIDKSWGRQFGTASN